MVATTNTMMINAVNSYPTSCSVTTNLSPMIPPTIIQPVNQLTARVAMEEWEDEWYIIQVVAPPNNVVLTLTETVTISDVGTPGRLAAKNRTATDTITTAPTTLTRLATKQRPPAATEIITLSDSLVRRSGKIRNRWSR